MTEFVLTATIQPAQKDRAHIRSALNELRKETIQEEGCITYVLHSSIDPEGALMLYEVWQSEAHWRSHLETEHLAKFKLLIRQMNLSMNVEKFNFEGMLPSF